MFSTACHWLGFPVVPFYPLLGEGSLTKMDYRKKGTLILTSLLEDLDWSWGLTALQFGATTRKVNPPPPPGAGLLRLLQGSPLMKAWMTLPPLALLQRGTGEHGTESASEPLLEDTPTFPPGGGGSFEKIRFISKKYVQQAWVLQLKPLVFL